MRHAHRLKAPNRAADNGLSPKGRKQSRELVKLFRKRHGNAKPLIFSSPKIRCVETVEPIAWATGARVHLNPLLDEGGNTRAKARAVLREWKRSRSALTILCSHGDWLPEALEIFAGVTTELKKGAYAELEYGGRGPRLQLTWLVQEP